MSKEVIFADGVLVKESKYSTRVTVIVDEFKDLVKKHGKLATLGGEQKRVINLEIKTSKAGNIYCAVDTWEPDPNYRANNSAPKPDADDWS